MTYGELTPEDIAALRVFAALEQTYPEEAAKRGDRRASVILAGWNTWRATMATKRARAA